jgi:hypothetical protein
MTSLEQFMSESFEWVAYGTLALAPVVFAILFFVEAPYGRHIRKGWGPVLENRWGWFFMEMPASLIFAAIILFFAELNVTVLAFLGIWQLHYFHRTFIYPWTLQKGRKMPWLILIMAVVFNTSNAYLNSWSIVSHAQWYSEAWLSSPQFLTGIAVFFAGMALNKSSRRQGLSDTCRRSLPMGILPQLPR